MTAAASVEASSQVLVRLPRAVGEARVSIKIGEGKAYVEIGRYEGDVARARQAFPPEDLDKVIEGLQEARRLLLGPPQRAPVDPVLLGKRRA